jgi:putative glutamine amidotransferase
MDEERTLSRYDLEPMTRPRIGITRDSADPSSLPGSSFGFYAASIEKAGGQSVPICYSDDLSGIAGILDQIDGLVFSGGDDLDPQLYGEDWHPNAKRIEPIRQRFELSLLAAAEKRRLPVLGICLGIQLMNVHRGGTLIQFLPDYDRANPLEHRKLEAILRRHPVRIDPDSILGQAIGKTEISGNTYHKQAIARVGRNLRATASSPDGIIEAVEDPAFPLFLGVQWHPERLHEEPEHLAIFKLLVSACQSRKQTT